MKFAAGYQCIKIGEKFSELIRNYLPAVGEVYFSYPGIASGRPEFGNLPDKIRQTEDELAAIKNMGVTLDLLINGSCYGRYAVSEKFERQILTTIDHLGRNDLMPGVVTTTTPFAAAAVKKYFPEIEVRASVNMRILTVAAMEFLEDKFDSFYIHPDILRDLKTVRIFSDWCRKNGKKIGMLANCGCLRNCPYQTFHDNLVSHDDEIREIRNVRDFQSRLCLECYQNKENICDFLRSGWIRPEDTAKYETLVDVVKLATRNTSSIRMILDAYISGEFDGNMLDLTEPAFSNLFAPAILDNRLLEGFELPAECSANCSGCGRCEEILRKAFH